MTTLSSILLTSILGFLLSGWPFVSVNLAGGTLTPSPTPHTAKTSKNLTSAKLVHAPVGTTTVSFDPQGGKAMITIALTGLAPKSKHTAFLQSGTCKQNSGQVLSTLNDVVVNATGGGKSATTLTSLPDTTTNTWSIVVQNGVTQQTDPNMAANDPSMAANDPNMAANDPSMAANDPSMAANDPNMAANDPSMASTDPSMAANDPTNPLNGNDANEGTSSDPTTLAALEQRSISCGDAPAMANANGTARITMRGTAAANENTRGTVSFKSTQAKGKLSALTVILTLTGLEPNSSHIAHIHAGSCKAQGAVLATLMNVRVDAKGRGTSKTTITSITELKALSTAKALYVNVHTGSTMQQLNQAIYFNPIACGDLHLHQKASNQIQQKQGTTTAQTLQ